MADTLNKLGEDWLTALARVETAAVAYQQAKRSGIVHNILATREYLLKAALLLPLDH